MQEIESRQNERGYYRFSIKTDEGTIFVSFENNLDLYMSCEHEGNMLEAPLVKNFTITKENYEIYQIFDNLYHRVTTGFPHDGIDEEDKDIFFRWLLSENNPEALVKDGIICWHSDDYYYENASVVCIEKVGDKFVITFKKSKLAYDDGLLMTYAVRIRNSGSRYNPFNCAFMQMYQELKGYNPEYHQIHLEELAYDAKKLNRTLDE